MTNSRLIHVGNTRAGRKLFFRLERERQKLMASGFEPTPKLLAAKLDVDERDLDEVGRHLDSREVPFDPRPGESQQRRGLSAERTAVGRRAPHPRWRPRSAELNEGGAAGSSPTSADSLTDARERAVWHEHLAADNPVPLGELGARFGVSKQRMGQIADQLKRRFRTQIVEKLGPEIRTDWLGAGGVDPRG